MVNFMPPILSGFFLLAWLLIISAALGRRLFSWMRFEIPDFAEFMLLSVGLGFGALQFVPFTLFVLGIGQSTSQGIAALLLTIALGRDIQSNVRLCRKHIRRPICPAWSCIFIAAFSILLTTCFLRSLCPTLISDGLSYHLSAALRPLQAGKFVYIPTLTYTNWPTGTEMLFALLIGIHPDAPTALVQFTAGLIVCLAVFLLGRRMVNQHVGLAALVLLLLVKDFWAEMCTSMVDVTLTAFTTLAIFCFQKFVASTQKERVIWSNLAAIFTGFAATTKLTGAWVIICFTIMYALVLYRRKQTDFLRHIVTFSGIALLVTTPWFVKTWVVTGNPFYPLFHNRFGGIEWTPTGWERFKLAHLIYNTPSGQQPTPQVLYTTHRIIAIVGIALGILFVRIAWNSRFFVLLSTFGLFLACISVGNYFNARFLLPVLPAFFIFLASPLKQIRLHRRLEWALCSLCVLLATLLVIHPGKKWVANISDAVSFAVGQTSREKFQETHISDYAMSRYANEHLSVNVRILLNGSHPVSLYNAQALTSTYNLQDSIHYGSQAELINDLRRLNVTYLVLAPYPDDCDNNHACRLARQTERPALEELASRQGKVIYQSGKFTLYALSL